MGTIWRTWLAGAIWATGVTLAAWALLAIGLRIAQNRYRRHGLPMDEGPSAPAACLRAQIACRRMATHAALWAMLAAPIVFGAAYGVFLYLDTEPLSAEGVAVAGTLGLALWAWTAWKWRRTVRDLDTHQWAYDAKALVAEYVYELKGRGFEVFDDCRLDGKLIDHILVGPKGVFTVQAFAGPNALQDGANIHGTVTYDGRALFFPGSEDHETVVRAGAEAERLSEWLSEALDMPLAARAIVALPGWQVKRTSAEGISVINPTQFEALFQYVRPRPLAPDAVVLIVEQLRRHCDEAPVSARSADPSRLAADLRHPG